MKKIMLINPSNTMPSDSVRRLGSPLGLLYLGAVLKQEDYKINILDSTCEGYYNTLVKGNYITYGLNDDEVTERIKRFKPDVVGVSSMFSAHQDNAVHHCDLVKSIDKDIVVVLGGIHPSLFPKDSIENKSVDFVIMGEGEYRFVKLLKMLREGKRDFDFDGVAYKKDGKVIINPMTSRIEDLDSIPFPARELIDFEKYIEIGVPYAPFPRRERTAQLMTSRGCPFHCNFCATVKYWGRRFRVRSVDNIMEEIDLLVNKYRIEEIQFLDDNMTVNKKRAIELFKRMKEYDLAWCTPHGVMAKTIDENMIKLMAESGAYQLSFGIESGSQRVLKEIIRKPVPPKTTMKKLVEAGHKHNIQIHGMFIVGFPGETKEEIDQTLQYPFDVGFDSASFFIANPMPGSDLFKECKEKGYLTEGAKMDVKSADICIPEGSPEFVMYPNELVKLVDDKTRMFNEQQKKKHPDQWDIKFKQFLKKHGDKADLILGRVT